MIDVAARIAHETAEEESVNGRPFGARIAKPIPPKTVLLSEFESFESHESRLSRPGFWLRLWRYFRKLIRKRQESALVKQAQRDAGQFKAQAVLSERQAESHVQKVEREKSDLSKQIRDLQSIIDGKDSEIAKRDREIDVLQKNVDHLESLHESELSRRKAEISVNNRVIAEAELGERRMSRSAMEQV